MKKPTYKGKELLPLSVIDAARDGDSQAVDQVPGIMRAISISSAFTILRSAPFRQHEAPIDKLIHSIV